jgi:pSer/pThr/pTyr-binding forkhead associated (FHA) protein
MNPRDMVLFADFIPALCRQMETWLTDLASERRVSTIDRIKVDIAADPAVSRRAINVDASMADYGSAFAPQSQMGQRTEMFRSAPVSTSQLRVAQLILSGGRYALTKDVTTLGRSGDNDIVIASGDVSRHHARFEYASNYLWLVDLNSTNGTRVNDAPVTSRISISDGDRVVFGTQAGQVTFAFDRHGPR